MWEVLGIAPTRDAKAIRRAYAARLRALGADPEAAAFQALRTAYERALARAAVAEPALEPVETGEELDAEADNGGFRALSLEEVSPIDSGIPLPLRPLARVEVPAEVRDGAVLDREIATALQQRRYNEGFAAFDRGMASGILPLGAQTQFADRIMSALLQDGDLPAEDFIAFMRRVGWDSHDSNVRISGVRRAATDRLNAELWYQHLARVARGGYRPNRGDRAHGRTMAHWLQRRSERASARVVVGMRHPFLMGSKRSARELARLFAEAQHYATWLGTRLDKRTLDHIGRLLARDASWGAAARGTLSWILTIAVLAAVLAALYGAGYLPLAPIIVVLVLSTRRWLK
jgi:hypothetical protein